MEHVKYKIQTIRSEADVFLSSCSSHGCCSGSDELYSHRSPSSFCGGGFGFLICSACGGKHCMIYQSLETACMTAAGSLLCRAAANAGWRGLREVTSACREAAVKSRLACWKRQQSGRPSAPPIYHFLNFFRCSASRHCRSAIACSRLLALVPGARGVARR